MNSILSKRDIIEAFRRTQIGPTGLVDQFGRPIMGTVRKIGDTITVREPKRFRENA